MTQHALLSASAAHRWLACTAAPLLEATFPDTTSSFAKEGTLAHSIGELKVRRYAVEPMSNGTFTRRFNKLKKDELYQSEMDGYTEEYLDYIKNTMLQYPVKPYVVIEKKVDFSHIVPKGFGTADCLIMTPEILHVIDFKYGKGVPVSAEDNPQMRLYAVGALKAYGLLYSFKEIHMTIVQPRIGNISEALITPAELQMWATNEVAPKAQEAMAGKGTFEPGEHCRFCRAKAQCKARSEHYAAYQKLTAGNPSLLTMQELGAYLGIAKQLKSWADDLQDYSLTCCLDGKDVPGWKAVEGRGSRVFTDQTAAFKILMDNGIDEALLYNRVPLTLAQSEKVVGKKEFNDLLADYIIKNIGKPTLAPEADNRPAISNQVKAKDVFTKLEEN